MLAHPTVSYRTEPAALSRRALLGVGGAALLTSCAPRRDHGGLSLWGIGKPGETVPQLLPTFERATGIAVDVQALPWTAAHEKILTAYAGGSLPDVMMVRNAWVAELAMLGALAPMPGGRLTADQFPAVLAGVGGGACALPWVLDAQVQFYRRDLVEAAGYAVPPTDWTGWKAMAHAIKRRAPDRYAVLLLLDWPEQLFNFAAQQPEPLLRDRNTRGNFASAGLKAVLAFYKSLFDEGLAPRLVGTDLGDTLGSFEQGYFALWPAAADTVGDLHLRAAEIPRSSWAVTQMPGPSGPATGMVDGSSLVVSRTARDSARAWQLARYLCRPITQLRFHALTGDLPSRPSAWAAPQLASDAVAATFGRQLAHGVTPPAVPEWERIVTEVQLIAEHMVRGQLTVDGAATAMDARVDALLAKRRWLLDRGHTA